MATIIILSIIITLIVLALVYLKKNGACAGCENKKTCSQKGKEKSTGSCASCPMAGRCSK